MDLKEFRERMRGGESERLELKREVRDLRVVGWAVCAVANSSGGMVVVGVDDRGGVSKNLRATKAWERRSEPPAQRNHPPTERTGPDR